MSLLYWLAVGFCCSLPCFSLLLLLDELIMTSSSLSCELPPDPCSRPSLRPTSFGIYQLQLDKAKKFWQRYGLEPPRPLVNIGALSFRPSPFAGKSVPLKCNVVSLDQFKLKHAARMKRAKSSELEQLRLAKRIKASIAAEEEYNRSIEASNTQLILAPHTASASSDLPVSSPLSLSAPSVLPQLPLNLSDASDMEDTVAKTLPICQVESSGTVACPASETQVLAVESIEDVTDGTDGNWEFEKILSHNDAHWFRCKVHRYRVQWSNGEITEEPVHVLFPQEKMNHSAIVEFHQKHPLWQMLRSSPKRKPASAACVKPQLHAPSHSVFDFTG